MWMIHLDVALAEGAHLPPHPRWGQVRGAHVCAMISFPDETGAQALASHYATADGTWQLRAVKACQPVTRGSLLATPQLMAGFDEARREGFSLIFHVYCDHWDEESGQASGVEQDADDQAEVITIIPACEPAMLLN